MGVRGPGRAVFTNKGRPRGLGAAPPARDPACAGRFARDRKDELARAVPLRGSGSPRRSVMGATWSVRAGGQGPRAPGPREPSEDNLSVGKAAGLGGHLIGSGWHGAARL